VCEHFLVRQHGFITALTGNIVVMRRETVVKGLRDGQYMATCKERNALAAAMNGHGPVFPQARCIVAKGEAVFDRDGVELWRCNAAYAEVHFKLEPVD